MSGPSEFANERQPLPDHPPPHTSPLVSVIIPARDSAATLASCLISIADQTYSPIETIVVDNGSRDETPDIAKRLSATVVSSGGLRTAARNCGVKKSSGSYLLHIDSDMELPPKTVAACLEATTRGFDLVVIPERNVARGYWTRAFSFSKLLFDGIPGYENARFVTRRAFETIGGYDESLELGEDADLHLRLLASGCRLGRVDVVIRHHVGHLGLRDILRKSRQYDATRSRYVAKHGRVRQEGPHMVAAILSRRRIIAQHPLDAFGWFIVTGLMLVQSHYVALRTFVARMK